MGAVTTVVMPPGRKLVSTSWKGNDLWVLTREAVLGEKPDQIWSLDEYTGWGNLNFHIVLKETPRSNVPCLYGCLTTPPDADSHAPRRRGAP